MTLTVALTAPMARGHSISPGVNEFYDGLLHPIVDFAGLAVLGTISVLAAFSGLKSVRACLGALALGVLGGCILAFLGVQLPVSASVLLLLAAVSAGILIAADKCLPEVLAIALAAVLGIHFGIVSVTELAVDGRGGVFLLAYVLAVMIIAMVVSALALGAVQRGGWVRMAVRAAGAMAAAFGWMSLAWLAFR
ncbi:MAG: HupE/UreJ family protein [Opitutales bacterium]